MLAFLYYLNIKIKVDTVVSHIYFDSKYNVKCKFISTFIHPATITNYFHLSCTKMPALPALYIMGKLDCKTRMHSSRMRTAACCPYLPARTARGGGVSASGLGGVCSRRGVSHHAMGQTPPPVDRTLDTRFRKYYLAPTSLQAVNILVSR